LGAGIIALTQTSSGNDHDEKQYCSEACFVATQAKPPPAGVEPADQPGRSRRS
jgi:hypothetical protein